MIKRDSIALAVLDTPQQHLKGLLEIFSETHILVGGTAIALQLGHRRSIDFDLFCFGRQWSGKELMHRIKSSSCMFDLDSAPPFWFSDQEISELTLFFDGVKVQWIDFSRNPFDIPLVLQSSKNICGMPSLDLLDLWALKCYAMMYRSKRKDAVDVYMILQQWYTLSQLAQRAKEIFQWLYKELYTYETIIAWQRDMSEQIDRLPGKSIDIINILSYLKNQIPV
jgi:hypothetical protein